MNYSDIIDDSKYNLSELRFLYLRYYIPLEDDIDKPNKYGYDGWLFYANTWLVAYFDNRFYKEVRISNEDKKDINVFKTYMLPYINNEYFITYELYATTKELKKIEKRKKKLITAVNELSKEQYDSWLGAYSANGGSKRHRRSNKSNKKRISQNHKKSQKR
uniref:Uncharacterized protein n=1 Tax=viral metagenome TaxID=1070528 RepID=A0A6C0JKI5_9ZZZZ